jgi:hypothetical protein
MTRAILLLIGLLLSFIGTPSQAQNVNLNCWNPNATSGLNQWLPCNSTTPLQVNASVTASISGFTATSTGTPIAVTTGGVTGTLPAGTVVVATNVGATNGAYCALGASATTSSQYLSPGGGWFAFTVGASTQLTCITSTSTTTVNMTGGSGLPTGTGGGGGGGSGGAVTIASGGVASGAYASGAYASGSISNGADVALGSTTDTAAANGAATATLNAVAKGILTAAQAAIPAGTAIIGKVGIDQTTDVTTNGVEIAPTAGAAAGITAVLSAAAEANHILKGSPGNLYNAYATSTVAGYLLIFDATTAPADGAVTPKDCIPGALTQSGIYAASINYNPGPVEIFTTGITASWSSTGCFTKTASATAFIHGSVK